MMDFSYFHFYNRMVKLGAAEPLRCRCGTEYVTRLGRGDSPYLHCYSCGNSVFPGSRTYDDIVAAVEKYKENYKE